MTQPLTCREVAERGLMERYVAGRLSDANQLADFEAHLVECSRCQEDVRLAMTVRAELAARRPRRISLLGLGLAAAAAIAGLVVLRGTGPDVRALGAVRDAPLYLGVPVRATPAPADSLFERAMTAYTGGNYGAAATGLARALAAGGDSAPALFFLGASELMTGRPAAAADALRRVIGLGHTPYLPEAHYYLAKALLRTGDGDAALRELGTMRSGDTVVAASATALADSIRRLRKR